MLAEQQQQNDFQTCVLADETKLIQQSLQIQPIKNNRLNNRNVIYSSEAHDID